MAGGVTFIPELWAGKILKEADANAVMVANCTRKWSGEINGVGSKVNIQSINYPTVNTFVPGTSTITPEAVKDESRQLEITEAKDWAVSLNDVVAKQGTPKEIMAEVSRKGGIAFRNTSEAFVATTMAAGAGNSITEASLTTVNWFSTIMDARTLLHANNVQPNADVVLEVGPYIWRKAVLAEIAYGLPNDAIINGGFVSTQLGCKIMLANNITSTITSTDVVAETCFLRTMEAVAFAEQINKVEKYRPEGDFSDAIKALHLYGAKVVKPREIVKLALTTAAESTI